EKIKKDDLDLTEEKSKNKTLEGKIPLLENSESEKQRQLEKKDIDIGKLNEIINSLTKENLQFRQTKRDREDEHQNKMTQVNTLYERLDSELKRIQELEVKKETERFERMKLTWLNHEVRVENNIRAICKKHIIEYFDKEKLPFKGKPDNTIRINDEFVIFDAKSPEKDDLSNFSKYIKLQTESVKKYIKEPGVKKDIYLVIPSNTVEVIEQFTYNMGDYNVYVVTIDALEPIILCLKKIEEYEYLEQLSPEERENICRLIGKFAHNAKRRIQIDIFFQDEILSLLNKCKADLPKEILEKVIEFEKAEKLNPPQEKRAKQILTSDLEQDSQRIRREAEAKDILLLNEDGNIIKELPLYNEESKK
ncbi:MAG TPA: hypothetical protein VI757_04180, partial [Bacteroidia bacterium]|nr:hypothetical protein [Bacteroidia bacterium]